MNENLSPEWAECPKQNIFVRVFSGDVSLPITYWVWGGLGNAIMVGVYSAIEFNYASITMKPYGNLLLNSVYWIAIAYLVFIWVAVWRSAGKYQCSGWGTVARFMVGVGIVTFAGQFVTGLNQGLDEEASLTDEVRLYNSSLPVMLDESTRMDSVSYDNNRILFSHTMIDSAIDEYDVDLFNELMRASLLENLCVEPDSRDVLDTGTTYAYTYVDMNGTFITEIDIRRENCE